jgi:hypothetical protein
MLSDMQIVPETEQATFHAKVHEVANGVVRKYAPQILILIEVDGWFGSKWLGFSGKMLGALGVWSQPLSVPPFVPSRIVSQRRFISPDYLEAAVGNPLHITVPSSVAIRRKLATVEPNAAVLWFSRESPDNGHGALMTYIPSGGSYFHWYASWQRHGDWKIEETINISRQELFSLMESD